MSISVAYSASDYARNTASGTSLDAPAINTAANTLIVVSVRWESGGSSDSLEATITDTASNTYTKVGYKNTGSGSEDARVGAYYSLTGNSNAANVVNMSLGSSRTYREIIVEVFTYSGTAQLSATQGEGASATNTATITTDTSLSAVAGDVSFFALGWYNNFQHDAIMNDSFVEPELVNLSSLGYLLGAYSSAPSGTSDGSDTYCAITFSFEDAGATIIPQIMHHYQNNT